MLYHVSVMFWSTSVLLSASRHTFLECIYLSHACAVSYIVLLMLNKRSCTP